MRIACPPLTHPCEFLNFSRSRSNMDLASHIAIKELEGKIEDDLLKEYSDPGNGKYPTMVEQIKKRLGLTTLRYQKLSDLVNAIGLPKEKLCTYCWDGAESCCTQLSLLAPSKGLVENPPANTNAPRAS